jgi:hypothetical protein
MCVRTISTSRWCSWHSAFRRMRAYPIGKRYFDNALSSRQSYRDSRNSEVGELIWALSTLSPIPRARERGRQGSGALSANQHPVLRIPRWLREAGNDRSETR